MSRPVLWVVALVMAAAPALADVCRFDCERDRQPECPLHQQAPHKCGHDHTAGAAGLTRASSDASRPPDSAIAVPTYRLPITSSRVHVLRVERQHAPPRRSTPTTVLRI